MFNQLDGTIRKHIKNDFIDIKMANGTITTTKGYIDLSVDFGPTSRLMKCHIIEGLLTFKSGHVVKLNGNHHAQEPQLIISKQILIKPFNLAKLPIKLNSNGNYMTISDDKASLYIVDGVVNERSEWVYAFNATPSSVQLETAECLNITLKPLHEINIMNANNLKPVESSTAAEEEEYEVNPEAPTEAKTMLEQGINKVKEKLNNSRWGTSKIEHRIRLRDEIVSKCHAYIYGPQMSSVQS